MKEYILNTVIIIAVIVICYLSIVGFKCIMVENYWGSIGKKEKFSEFSPEHLGFQSYCEKDLEKFYFTTENNDLKISGMVFKSLNKDNGLTYLYKFNLPIPYGGDYNTMDYYYNVYAEYDKDETLVKIGELNRGNDGWFYLQHRDDKKIKKTTVKFESGSGESAVLFSKKLM